MKLSKVELQYAAACLVENTIDEDGDLSIIEVKARAVYNGISFILTTRSITFRSNEATSTGMSITYLGHNLFEVNFPFIGEKQIFTILLRRTPNGNKVLTLCLWDIQFLTLFQI